MATRSSLATRRDVPQLAPIKTSFREVDDPLQSPLRQRTSDTTPPKPTLSPSSPSISTKTAKSKSSIFGLRTRSNAERALGRHDTSVPVSPQPQHHLDAVQSSLPQKRDDGLRSVLKKVEPSEASRGAQKLQRDKFVSIGTQSSNNLRPTTSDTRLGGCWEPPPLFQVYPQAIRHCRLEAPHSPQGNKYRGKKIKNESEDTSDTRTVRRRPSFFRPKGGSSNASSHTLPSPIARADGSRSRKIYVLVTSGYLLQYAAEGSSERKPEKVLKLGPKSAAFASDVIPGKHFVLQIVQMTVEVDGVPCPPRKSFMSKLGISNPIKTRNNSDNILMVFERPEDMNKWMISIRKEIDHLAGNKVRSPTTPRRATIEDWPSSSMSHRYLNLPVPYSGPSSPVKSTASASNITGSDCARSVNDAWTDCSSQKSVTPNKQSDRASRVELHQQIAKRSKQGNLMKSNGTRGRSDRTSRMVAQLPTPPGTSNKSFVDSLDNSQLFPLVEDIDVVDPQSPTDYAFNVLGWRPPKVPELSPAIERTSQEEDEALLRSRHLLQVDDACSEATPPLTGNSLLSQFPVPTGSTESAGSRFEVEQQPSQTLIVSGEDPANHPAGSKPMGESVYPDPSEGLMKQEPLGPTKAWETHTAWDLDAVPPASPSSGRPSTTFRSSSLQPLQLVSTSEPSNRRGSDQATSLAFPSKRMLRSNAPVPLRSSGAETSTSTTFPASVPGQVETSISQPGSPRNTALRRLVSEGASKASPPSSATPRALARPPSLLIRPSHGDPVKSGYSSGPPSPQTTSSTPEQNGYRNSTLVPVVRPGLIKNGSGYRTAVSLLNLPPMDPPPGIPLPSTPITKPVEAVS
ncbi:MAG: hypothetical protein M1828_006947 [Chrysothrix sp. TS-e1954]|nr:MAG: hypothetical protein M1828_006947 [Chrysothrix sp. TS-e1954]